MGKKRPRQACVAQVIWTLIQIDAVQNYTIGQFSTEQKAVAQVQRLLAQATGQTRVRLPDWTPLPSGSKELVYDKHRQSWRFQLEPWPVDGEAA